MSDNFENLSRFNPDANFKLVRIGEDKPVLETELNEMQDIAEHRVNTFIKDYIGDGISGDGSITYADGLLTISNEKAFVQGNVIEITSLTLPLAEGQKAYLKVWEQNVKVGDLIKYKGNMQEEREVENNLLDSRAGFETSRRIQVVYDLVDTKEASKNKVSYVEVGYVEDGQFFISCDLKTDSPRKGFDVYTSKDHQQLFVTKSPYKVGVHALQVYVDGIVQTVGVHYDEHSKNSVKFKDCLSAGHEVVLSYDKAVVARYSNNTHSHLHTKEGDDAIDILDLADRTGLLAEIQEALKIKRIDCGSFTDHKSPIKTTIDGGYF